jgi:hypothetical protein
MKLLEIIKIFNIKACGIYAYNNYSASVQTEETKPQTHTSASSCLVAKVRLLKSVREFILQIHGLNTDSATNCN